MKPVFIIAIVAVAMIGMVAIPQAQAEVLCWEQMVFDDRLNIDEMLTLCEQGDLWDEVNAIWDYLGTNVGVSNTNTDTVSTNLEQLVIQNNKLNQKITSLENRILELENIQKIEETSSCWFFC